MTKRLRVLITGGSGLLATNIAIKFVIYGILLCWPIEKK